MTTGNLLETFCSYQGEGIHAGVPQVFIRMSGCHLRCTYCDTPESWTASKTWREEIEPFTGKFRRHSNPAAADEVAAIVKRYAGRAGFHSVSVTGGEPLLQTEFLEALLPRLPLPVYLETSGTLSGRLARIERYVHTFALDFKPPSTPGVRLDWSDFESCVRIAAGRPSMVKVVVMEETPTGEEIDRLAGILRRVDPRMPIVFTPVTPVNDSCRPAGGERIARLRERAAGLRLAIIPQIHPLAGWR